MIILCMVLQQLRPFDYVVLFLTFTYLSFWLARRFNKKTFKISVIENLTESREENFMIQVKHLDKHFNRGKKIVSMY